MQRWIAVLVFLTCALAQRAIAHGSDDEVCRPKLVKIGASVKVPAILDGVLGPDPHIGRADVRATPAGLHWIVYATVDAAWIEDEVPKLARSWSDDGLEHELTFEANAENNVLDVTYRCGPATPVALTAARASAMSDDLDTAWIPSWCSARWASASSTPPGRPTTTRAAPTSGRSPTRG